MPTTIACQASSHAGGLVCEHLCLFVSDGRLQSTLPCSNDRNLERGTGGESGLWMHDCHLKAGLGGGRVCLVQGWGGYYGQSGMVGMVGTVGMPNRGSEASWVILTPGVSIVARGHQCLHTRTSMVSFWTRS